GVPHIVRTVHGLTEPLTGWNRVKYAVYEMLDKILLRWCADRVVAVSNRMAGTLIANGYRASLVTTIHNGIDLRSVMPGRGREEIRREWGVNDAALVIGTAGRLSPVKGHDTLLRAARLILDCRPDARFLIAGDGPLEHDLKALASQLRIDAACAFLGARADITDVMSAMDVFVLPSLNEGLPMAVLEAMA